MTIIEMRDKRTKLLATMDGFLDTHRDGKGVLSAEDDATYAGMEKELAAITNEIKRMERREAIDAELSKPVSTPITDKPMNGSDNSAKTGSRRSTDEYVANFWEVMLDQHIAQLMQRGNHHQGCLSLEANNFLQDQDICCRSFQSSHCFHRNNKSKRQNNQDPWLVQNRVDKIRWSLAPL